MAGNRIARTKMIDGVVTPVFICNGGSYFFINLEVYADGLVNCWEFVDFPLFQEKLRIGWVKTRVPDGKEISVHGLGAWTIAGGSWELDSNALLERVKALVQELNPRMENLHDCHGRTSEKIGNVMFAIAQAIVEHPVRLTEPGPFAKRIKGDNISIFVRDARWYLADLRAFADGAIELGRIPVPETLDLERLRQAVEQGRVASSVPNGTRVEIHELGSFVAAEEQWSANIDDLLREVPDLIESANGRPDSIKRCRATYEDYLENPTEALRDELRIAYEAIPAHNRRYAGDMDTKDVPIRMILYGEQEIESWSHRVVARARGEPLPEISVPKPKPK